MAIIYKTSTNTDPTKAILGEQSPAVLTLQQAINKANAQRAGYTPIAEDSKYGPQTQSAFTQYGYTPSAPTIGSVYQLPTTQEDPNLTAARVASDNFHAGTTGVDEEAIRKNTLAQFQAEIDAVNSLYADKLRQAKIAGGARLGSSGAIQARRGLLGSDFGNAETDTINQGNTDINNSIENEKNAAVTAILTKARTAGTDAIAEKTKAIGEGLDAHLKYLQEAGERKKTNAQKAAEFIYSQKLSPDQLTPDQLTQTASGYGVTADDIKNSYIAVKKAGDEAKAKAEADATKALPASAQEYEYAVGQGYKGTYSQYQTEDANRKALATKAPGTLQERNQEVVTKINTLFSPGYTIPGSGGVPYIDAVNGYATPEGFKIAIKASGLPRTDFIKQFGYLIAPGLESKYGITPAEIKLITGAIPEE